MVKYSKKIFCYFKRNLKNKIKKSKKCCFINKFNKKTFYSLSFINIKYNFHKNIYINNLYINNHKKFIFLLQKKKEIKQKFYLKFLLKYKCIIIIYTKTKINNIIFSSYNTINTVLSDKIQNNSNILERSFSSSFDYDGIISHGEDTILDFDSESESEKISPYSEIKNYTITDTINKKFDFPLTKA